MERIKELSWMQKAILLALAAMIVIFAFIYPAVISREGILYRDTILVKSEDAAETVYSGRIQGKESQFIVLRNMKRVTFRHGEKEYGPYTVREDPTAVPAHEAWSDQMTGIEVLDGETIMFRGGILYTGTDRTNFTLYNEDGWYPGISITATMSDGTVVDGNGNVVDLMEPDLGTILHLINDPEPVHKGMWIGWIAGVVLSVISAVSILYADELFRWRLSFKVHNAYDAEPTDLEIAGRYIGWLGELVMILVLYIMGLGI